MKREVISKDTRQLNELRQAAANNPESATAHLRLGTALLKIGLIREAEKECRCATELAPNDPRGWVHLGGVLLSIWDFNGCIEANEKALACDPELMQAHYNKGLGHLYLGQAEQMVACFGKVLEIDPGNPGGYYHLAVGLLELGNFEQASANLDKAIGLGYKPEPDFLRELDKHKNHGAVVAMEIGPNPKDDSTDNN